VPAKVLDAKNRIEQEKEMDIERKRGTWRDGERERQIQRQKERDRKTKREKRERVYCVNNGELI